MFEMATIDPVRHVSSVCEPCKQVHSVMQHCGAKNHILWGGVCCHGNHPPDVESLVVSPWLHSNLDLLVLGWWGVLAAPEQGANGWGDYPRLQRLSPGMNQGCQKKWIVNHEESTYHFLTFQHYHKYISIIHGIVKNLHNIKELQLELPKIQDFF